MKTPFRIGKPIMLWLVQIGVFTASLQIPLWAVTRNALVLGNDAYPGNRLQNAVNDARSVAKELKVLGYRTTLAVDLDRITMSQTVQAFSDTLQPGDLAFVYYAGHGLQVAGENYLVPVDFHLSDEADVAAQGYPLGEILDKLTVHGARTQVIVLDSCRDNPFLASRSTSKGWASLGTSIGTFLAFGTSPGSTASDDPTESHGLFTKALLAHLGDTSIDIEGLFRLVREEVVRVSSGRQVPWTSSSLLGTLHIDPRADASSPGLAPVNLASFGQTNTLNRGVDHHLADRVPVQSLKDPADISEDLLLPLLTEAQTNLRSLNFGKAITILEAVLQLDPRCGVALRLLAVAMHFAGRDIESEDTVDRAIAINPQDVKAFAIGCLISVARSSESSLQRCAAALDPEENIAAGHGVR